MMVRRLFLLGFVAALLAAFGCSNDGGNGTTPPQLSCTAGGVTANTVSLSCGGSTDGTTETIDVVMGGPSSGATTLRGLNFDVTYATSNLAFVPGGSYTSPLFPDALIVVSLFNGQPGRVVVSIQQPGNLPAVSVGAGSHDVLSLSFSRVSGVTFNPTALLFENAEATSASASIAFTSSLALSYQ